MTTSDPHRVPGDADRMAVLQALSRARRQERLSAEAQLDRTEAALTASTMAELRRLVADLEAEGEPPLASRRTAMWAVLGVGATIVGGTVVGYELLKDEADAIPRVRATNVPSSSTAPTTPTSVPTPASTPTPKPVPSLYTLAGLKLLLKDYHDKFGTWWTYELSVFDTHQARSDVPVGALNKRRLQWWSWDDDDRWNTIFDPQSITDPTTRAVDLRTVNLKAALANLKVARRTLNVENPGQPDFSFESHPSYGPVVMFYVSNSFSEGGLMFTDLDGAILARQPFRRA